MQELIQADIFFFISSAGFILLFIALLVTLGYVIALLRSVYRITRKIEEDAAAIGDEAKELVMDIRHSRIFGWVIGKRRRN